MPLSLQIFLESFGAALAIPVSGEHVFAAMQSFGSDDMRLPAVLAVAGAMVAQLCNWIAGIALREFKRQEKIVVSPALYEAGVRLFRGPWIGVLLLSWANFGAVLTVAAAFFGAPARRAFALLLAGWAGYFLYRLYV